IVDPTNANKMFVGSVSGGIWRTSDAGTSWQPVDDFMANLAVSTMVLSPTNSNILYAGTGEGFSGISEFDFSGTYQVRGAGVFQSTDAGTTWSHLASTTPGPNTTPICANTVGTPPCPSTWRYVSRLAMSPDGTTLLAATNLGIMRSTDGGVT